jgi:Zn-dependent peptidase ImmA (M78 family)/DNA-binding XRE family transcriptional regulator
VVSSVPSSFTGSGRLNASAQVAGEVGARVRRLRLAAGLGQVEFAERVGLANGAVSMIENGRMPMPEDLLTRLAKVLRCTPDFLTRAAPSPLATQPLMRAYADAPKRAVDRQLADASLVLETASVLGLRALPDTIPTFDGDLSDEAAIEQFAQDVRAAAQLAEGDVVGNAMRAAERLGCVVLPMPDELGRHLGMSLRIDATPVLCVSRAASDPGGDVPGDRQRFTVLHEVGHLGLHSHLGPPQTAEEAARFEKQAHLFAGAFLAPGDAMLDELQSLGGRVTLQTLASIKSRWGISIKALVMRFRQLGVVDADQARSLYKQISARGWNKGEPVPVGAESAIWLSKAIDKKFAASPKALGAAAAQAGLDVSHLQRWTDWTRPAVPAGQVVELGARRRPDTPIRSTSATVTSLSPRRR